MILEDGQACFNREKLPVKEEVVPETRDGVDVKQLGVEGKHPIYEEEVRWNVQGLEMLE